MTRRQAVINQKGGVGKTSLVQNVSYELSQAGYRTLMVDFDPQSNLTQGFGVNPEDERPTVYDALLHPEKTASYILNVRNNLDLLPSNLNLAGAEREFSQVPFGRTTKLKHAIDAIEKNYNYILIDSPPSLGFYTVNALIAANEVLIPMQCHFYAFKMIAPVLAFIQEAQVENPKLKVAAIIPTMFDGRTSLSEGVMGAVRKQYNDLVTTTFIPSNVRIADAPIAGLAVREHDPKSAGALAYMELTKELIARG